MVAASRLSSSTPSMLKITAMGEMYVGSSTMFVPSTQPSNGPASISSIVNARSDPANATAPAWNDSRPAPEPDGVVRDGDVGVGGLEAGGPRLDGDFLRGRARAGDFAGEACGSGRVGWRSAAGLVRGAGGEGEGRDGADGADLGDSGELHCESFTVYRDARPVQGTL